MRKKLAERHHGNDCQHAYGKVLPKLVQLDAIYFPKIFHFSQVVRFL